jgi:Protein of unknown function (DUF429)
MEIYLGFDPGGEKQFGWAVCSRTKQRLAILAVGEANRAGEAFVKAISVIPKEGAVVGAGIDAPLFWSETGERNVDKLIRRAIQQLGAPSPGGTVQNINSLRGACLVQGVIIAKLLQKHYPAITITESHPKALLYLLGIANKKVHPSKISVAELSEWVDYVNYSINYNERDAILGSITAFAQKLKVKGWINLFEKEKNPITPFNYSAGYWMPLNLINS